MVMKEMQTVLSRALGKIIMYTVCSQHPSFPLPGIPSKLFDKYCLSATCKYLCQLLGI